VGGGVEKAALGGKVSMRELHQCTEKVGRGERHYFTFGNVTVCEEKGADATGGEGIANKRGGMGGY